MRKQRIFFTIGAITLLVSACTDSMYYSLQDFEKVRKADVHTHLFTANTAIAEQGKADNFLVLDVNLEELAILPLDRQRHMALFQQARYPRQSAFLSAFSTVGFESTDWTSRTIAQLKKDFDDGALGIKIWKNIGMTLRDSTGRFIMIDDPRFDSVINFVAQSGKSVMGHLGEPRNCWLPLDQMTVTSDSSYYAEHPEYHMYQHPEYPNYEAQIKARDNFLQRHRDLRFVAAHLGSLEWNVDELAKRLDQFPNMAADLTERICHLQYQSQKDYKRVRDFILRYQDRLIYGTDIHLDSTTTDIREFKQHVHKIWTDDWEYFVTDHTLQSESVKGNFMGLKLPKTVVDKIFFTNAMKWFKWNPGNEN